MTSLQSWKAGTAAVMAMAISTTAVAPVLMPASAGAQVIIGQTNSFNVTIPANVTFPLTSSQEKIVLSEKDTVPLELELERNITDRSGRILIPAGTKVKGELRPATRNGVKGSQFVARQLVYASGRTQSINAVSPVVTNKIKIKKGANVGNILKGAALGGGASALIQLITGDRRVATVPTIGGAVAGGIASLLLGRKEAEVISVDPRNDLDITLGSSLTVGSIR